MSQLYQSIQIPSTHTMRQVLCAMLPQHNWQAALASRGVALQRAQSNKSNQDTTILKPFSKTDLVSFRDACISVHHTKVYEDAALAVKNWLCNFSAWKELCLNPRAMVWPEDTYAVTTVSRGGEQRPQTTARGGRTPRRQHHLSDNTPDNVPGEGRWVVTDAGGPKRERECCASFDNIFAF